MACAAERGVHRDGVVRERDLDDYEGDDMGVTRKEWALLIGLCALAVLLIYLSLPGVAGAFRELSVL